MWKLLFIAQLACLLDVHSQRADSRKQSDFVLKGQLTGRGGGMLILWYPDTSGKYLRDTTFLQKGRFLFKGFISYPSFVHLIGSEKAGNRISFFLDPGTQTINLKENHFELAQLKGSKTQESYHAFNRTMAELEQKVTHLVSQLEKLKANNPAVNKKEVDNQIEGIGFALDSARKQIDQAQSRFIENHPDSYASATVLLGVIPRYPTNISRNLFNSLNVEIRESRVGVMCENELRKLERLSAGSRLNDFIITVENGKTLSLKDFSGKYVLLDFWASWCLPCRAETPGLKKSYEAYHKRGFEIICISLDSDKSAWEKAIATDKTEYWSHMLLNDKTKTQFEAVKFIPQKLLLDRDGEIIWSSLETNDQDWNTILLQHLDIN